MSSRASGSTEIIVSVAMITYNHEQFVAQAIESVLMQEADFAFELVIGEDCSTDGTRSIVAQYAQRYPDLIRPLLHEQNLGRNGNNNFIAVMRECKGKYIAYLEGDDYWTDLHKLQKQVDFLEANSDCSICFHWVNRFVQTTGQLEIQRRRQHIYSPYYNLDDFISGKIFIPSVSMMLRNGLIPELPAWFYEAPVSDWPLLVLYAQQGKIGLIDQILAVYRLHPGGVWSEVDEATRQIATRSLFEMVGRHLGPRYVKQIKIGFSTHLFHLAVSSAHRGDLSLGRALFLRSISESFLNPNIRIRDKLILLMKLYASPVFNTAKHLQASLFSPNKQTKNQESR
jgi:glycosyltransferase involved in cell wall biosynthesis